MCGSYILQTTGDKREAPISLILTIFPVMTMNLYEGNEMLCKDVLGEGRLTPTLPGDHSGS